MGLGAGCGAGGAFVGQLDPLGGAGWGLSAKATLLAILPTSGIPGDTLVIHGANLGESAGTVTFGGGVLGTIVSWTSTLVTVTAPAGIATGKLTLTTASGQTTNGLQWAAIPPTELPVPGGLQLWLHAEGLAGLANGATVTTWSDSSGAGYHLDAGIGGPPTLTEAAFGGAPGVTFDGLGQGLTGPANLGFEGDATYTVILIASIGAGQTGIPAFWVFGDPAQVAGGAALIGKGGTLALATGHNHDADLGAGTYDAHFGVPTIVSVAKSAGPVGASTHISLNGAPQVVTGPATVPNMVDAPFELGSWKSTQPGALTVGEVLVYEGALSATKLQAVECYLAQKYGIPLAGGFPCAEDADADGVFDGDDNCPETPNLSQANADGDAEGDACDDDDDNDGTPDSEDCGPLNPAQKPGATEVCNDIDDDCDDDVDEFVCVVDPAPVEVLNKYSHSIWDIDFDEVGNTYYAEYISGKDNLHQVSPDGVKTTYKGVSNWNLGFGASNPDASIIVGAYAWTSAPAIGIVDEANVLQPLYQLSYGVSCAPWTHNSGYKVCGPADPEWGYDGWFYAGNLTKNGDVSRFSPTEAPALVATLPEFVVTVATLPTGELFAGAGKTVFQVDKATGETTALVTFDNWIISASASLHHQRLYVEVIGGTIWEVNWKTKTKVVKFSGLSEKGFLTVGPDFRLYRVRGRVDSKSTIEVYDLNKTPSCEELAAQNPALTTGVHTFDEDGDGPLPGVPVYCDMDTEGGGWTLCLRANQAALMRSRYVQTWGAGTDIATSLDSGGFGCTSVKAGPNTDVLFKEYGTEHYIAAMGVDFTVPTTGGKSCYTTTSVVNKSAFPDQPVDGFELKEQGEGGGQHATNFLGPAGCSCNANGRGIMLMPQYTDGTFKSYRDHKCGGGGPDYDHVGAAHMEVYVRTSK